MIFLIVFLAVFNLHYSKYISDWFTFLSWNVKSNSVAFELFENLKFNQNINCKPFIVCIFKMVLSKCIESVQLSLHWSLNKLCQHQSLIIEWSIAGWQYGSFSEKILNWNRQRIAGDMQNKPFEWSFKYKKSNIELWLQLFQIETKKKTSISFVSPMKYAETGCSGTRRIDRRSVLNPAVNGAMECVCVCAAFYFN